MPPSKRARVADHSPTRDYSHGEYGNAICCRSCPKRTLRKAFPRHPTYRSGTAGTIRKRHRSFGMGYRPSPCLRGRWRYQSIRNGLGKTIACSRLRSSFRISRPSRTSGCLWCSTGGSVSGLRRWYPNVVRCTRRPGRNQCRTAQSCRPRNRLSSRLGIGR